MRQREIFIPFFIEGRSSNSRRTIGISCVGSQSVCDYHEIVNYSLHRSAVSFRLESEEGRIHVQRQYDNLCTDYDETMQVCSIIHK